MKRQKDNSAKVSKGAIILLVILFVLSFGKARATEISPQIVVDLVNKARAEENLSALRESDVLDKVANAKAQDMVDNKYFAHTSPSGVSPWFWFGKEGYDYHYAGENLAIDFMEAEDQQAAWMKSEKHRQNILNDHYTEIGVAVAAGDISGHMSIITVQVFGAPAISGSGSENGENFSADKRSLEPKIEERKGVVLSSKELNPQSFKQLDSNLFSKNGNFLTNFKNSLGRSEKSILDLAFMILLVLSFAALAINPLLFTMKSFKEISKETGKKWQKEMDDEKMTGECKKIIKNNLEHKKEDIEIMKMRA